MSRSNFSFSEFYFSSQSPTLLQWRQKASEIFAQERKKKRIVYSSKKNQMRISLFVERKMKNLKKNINFDTQAQKRTRKKLVRFSMLFSYSSLNYWEFFSFLLYACGPLAFLFSILFLLLLFRHFLWFVLFVHRENSIWQRDRTQLNGLNCFEDIFQNGVEVILVDLFFLLLTLGARSVYVIVVAC